MKHLDHNLCALPAALPQLPEREQRHQWVHKRSETWVAIVVWKMSSPPQSGSRWSWPAWRVAYNLRQRVCLECRYLKASWGKYTTIKPRLRIIHIILKGNLQLRYMTIKCLFAKEGAYVVAFEWFPSRKCPWKELWLGFVPVSPPALIHKHNWIIRQGNI